MKTLLTALALIAAIAGARPFAHHSFSAEYDNTKPLSITGKLTKVDWMNPHIWYYIEVRNADGSVTNWAISGGAPGQLMRRGIRKEQLVIGSIVKVDGFRAKDGSNNGFGRSVTYEDGRNVLTAGQQDGPGNR